MNPIPARDIGSAKSDHDRMPRGVPYIVASEAAERFSYYGMNAILVPFMTHYLLNRAGGDDHLTPEQAGVWYHTFVSAAYFLPIVGAFFADALFGKFKTVLCLSLVYCAGHLALAMDHSRLGLMAGLFLIALGAGGIKPCVSAIVGDQFAESNKHLLAKVFSWFYFSINIGAAVSTMMIPWLLETRGPGIAFGVPGILMGVATVIFWQGRKTFVDVPPAGFRVWKEELLQRETLKRFANLLLPIPFVAMFWALWQQNFSSWVVQAEKMDRKFLGHEWLPAQIQTVSPLFVLLMLPLFAYVVYPVAARFVRVTPLRKIGAGLFVTVIAFLMVALIQGRIDAGERTNIAWQILAFVVLSAGEVMVSPTHLEFAYTQGPNRFKALVMCTYLGAISLGNLFTAGVDHFIQNADGTVRLQGAAYFYFFAGLLAATAILFALVSPWYRGQTSVQARFEPGVEGS